MDKTAFFVIRATHWTWEATDFDVDQSTVKYMFEIYWRVFDETLEIFD